MRRPVLFVWLAMTACEQLNYRCGNPSFECSPTSVPVTGWRIFIQISASQGDHVCGLTFAGSIYAGEPAG